MVALAALPSSAAASWDDRLGEQEEYDQSDGANGEHKRLLAHLLTRVVWGYRRHGWRQKLRLHSAEHSGQCTRYGFSSPCPTTAFQPSAG